MIVIRNIGVLSLAKFFGILYGGLGLVGSIFFTSLSFLRIILGGGEWSASGDSYLSTLNLATGLGAVVCLPVIYGILGLISGIVTAFLCNVALKFSGGLELEVDSRAKVSGLPATPPIVRQ